jgi:hypothetical protein
MPLANPVDSAEPSPFVEKGCNARCMVVAAVKDFESKGAPRFASVAICDSAPRHCRFAEGRGRSQVRLRRGKPPAGRDMPHAYTLITGQGASRMMA